MFFDTFQSLCDTKGISCKRACVDMGLSNSLATRWKKSGSTPNGATLAKIAEYFNVSVSYLLGEEKEKPTLSGEQISEARRKLDSELDDMSDEELLFLMSKIKAIKEMRG